MTQTATLNTKPHYAILDGLRGVAAVVVVLFHLFEVFITSRAEQIINHGYLAVDFFFILSGFVIGYAYDDRWGKMTVGEFVKRRIVRLHPMLVMGMVIGAALFYVADFEGSEFFAAVGRTSVWTVLIYLVLGCLMIPVTPSMDIRGWAESYPLNGPAWSLAFEYVANVLYMFVLRRLPTIVLGVLVVLSAVMTIRFCVTNGDIIGGWSLTGRELYVGGLRLAYPFLMGLLMARMGRLIRVRAAFWICAVGLVLVLSLPHMGRPWVNGLYEAFSIVVLFPLIVAMGAGGKVTGAFSTRACKFLGDISYPLYITHYSIVYIYWGWAHKVHPSPAVAVAGGAVATACCIALAYACLRFYDLPVRAWLARRWGMGKA